MYHDQWMGIEPSHNGAFTKQHGYGSIPIDTFLVGWTSIYQLFWGSLGTRVLTHPHILTIGSSRLTAVSSFQCVTWSCCLAPIVVGIFSAGVTRWWSSRPTRLHEWPNIAIFLQFIPHVDYIYIYMSNRKNPGNTKYVFDGHWFMEIDGNC